MSIWKTLAGEFTNGFANGFAGSSREMPVNRLCREIGWAIDEQQGKHTTLYFKGDHITPRRDVTISHAEGEPAATIMCSCRARFTSRSLPGDLALALLGRSKDTIGGWYAVFHEQDDTVAFVCGLAAPLGGMDAPLFKHICSSLVSEVAEVEQSLSNKGLL